MFRFNEENKDSKTKVFVKKSSNTIDIFIKGSNEESNRYIQYPLKRLTKGLDRSVKSSNFDIWRIVGCFEVERNSENNFVTTQRIATDGEWELAIREVGAKDAIGGSVHGDEIILGSFLLVDGFPRDFQETEEFYCNGLTLVCHSTLYRDNIVTPNELVKVGEHHKIYEFTNEGLTLSQEVVFSQSIQVVFSYLTMLPILRLEKYTEGKQITDHAFSDIDYNIFDVSKEGFNNDLLSRRPGIQKIWIYGEESGISANVEILNRNVWLPNENSRVDNPKAYNKFYFDFSGKYTTFEGEKWKQKTKFSINTIN